MKSTVDKYGKRIQEGIINPVVDVNNLGSGIIFNPEDENVPLQVVGLGVYKLNGEKYRVETSEKEYVFIPIDGKFTIKTEDASYEVEREGGPFDTEIGESNASAVYIPRDSFYEITGVGEIIYYFAPSSKKMKPVHVKRGEVPNLSRGDLFWRRNVITLIEPGVSTNLIIGETYSPPALWSGTPLHVHDVSNIEGGESEHEEIYYHLSRMKDKEVPNYTVQLLFDGKTMNKAYLCPNNTAFAIPGGSHPVVASPVSDCLYVWGLGGVEGHLGMRDLKDFAYMKKIGDFERKLREENGGKGSFTVSRELLDKFSCENNLDEFQRKVVELILNECGIKFLG